MLLKIQIGQKFGRWTVLSFLSKKEAREVGHKGGAAYLCECSCSKKTRRHKSSTDLLKGRSTSCGCERWENNKANSLKKYGTEVAAQRKEISAKRELTNIDRYGVSNPFKSNKLMASTRGASQTKEAKDKRKRTCEARYGANHPLKSSQVRERITRTKQKLGQIVTLSNGKTLNEMCQQYGAPHSSAHAIYKANGDAETIKFIESFSLENNATSIEKSLIGHCGATLYNKYVPGTRFRPDLRVTETLYVDTNGLYWHSIEREKYASNKDLHLAKREAIEATGATLLQFNQDEILDKLDIVKSIISAKAGRVTNRLFARKLTLKPVDNVTQAAFFKENHLMGATFSVKAIGLYNSSGELMMCLSYKISNRVLEISRLASRLDTVIIGGLSKLLTFLIENKDVDAVVSFVDLRYGNGKSLEKVGFKRVGVTLGWKWTDYRNTYNRLHCRANMDGRGLSEAEHARELGLTKIYDAGQAKYVLNVKSDNI